MLTSEQITHFQRLYLRRFGKEISKNDALIQGMKLLQLVQLIGETSEDSPEFPDNKK